MVLPSFWVVSFDFSSSFFADFTHWLGIISKVVLDCVSSTLCFIPVELDASWGG